AGAAGAVVDAHAFQVGLQLGHLLDARDQRALAAAVRLGAVLPQRDVFLRHVQRTRLVVRRAALGLAADLELPDGVGRNPAVVAGLELELPHQPALAVDERVVPSAVRAAVQAEAVRVRHAGGQRAGGEAGDPARRGVDAVDSDAMLGP